MINRRLAILVCFASGGCSCPATQGHLGCPPLPESAATASSERDCQECDAQVSASSLLPTPPRDAQPFVLPANRQNVGHLNERLQKLKPSWRDAAISLGINALREEATGIRSVNIEYLNDQGKPTGEGATKAVVVIIADVLDDSLMQERFRFELVRDGVEGFRYSKIEANWKCRPGRGAQDFTSSPCI